jgi:hypothetical protein
LPELVGLFALKALERLRMPILHPYHAASQQHMMHRRSRHAEAFAPQQDRQFTRSPVGTLLPKRNDTILDTPFGAGWAGLRTATALSDPAYTALTIASQP